MNAPLFDLVPIWTVILGLGVFFYVLLDGLARPGNVIVPQRSRLEALIDLYLEVVT